GEERLCRAVEQGVEADRAGQALDAGNGALVAELAAELARAVGRLVEQGVDRRDARILERPGDAAAENVAGAVEEDLGGEGAPAEVGVGERERNRLDPVGGRDSLRVALDAGRRNAGDAVA